jgi:hypothetical protein
MKVTRRYMIVGGTLVALAAGGAGAATALGGGSDGDGGATGPGVARARDAALRLFPGAHANVVERDSENGATWEVEITRADGKLFDVRLDGDYGLVVAEGDGEG